jgi:predicted nucleotidyltransferase
MSSPMEAIDRLVKNIVEAVSPLKIILFGSAGRGEDITCNDIDLLVVMPGNVHRRKTAQRLYRELHGVGFPFDILVVTPEDLEHHKNNIGLIYGNILREGREIYAA